MLRTDNGLEFCNEEFEMFYKNQGILRHKTIRNTPQQNGLTEKMNRTLLDRVRCMLHSSGLSKHFWGETVMIVCYLVNRTTSSAIDFKTPEELWFGKSSNYEHHRIFGCTAYVHQSEGKLEPRSIKCIFLGYLEGVKGYRLWNKESSSVKIIISHDVVFNENEMLSMRINIAGTKKDSENRSLTLDKDHFEFEVELSSQDGHDQQNDLAHGKILR